MKLLLSLLTTRLREIFSFSANDSLSREYLLCDFTACTDQAARDLQTFMFRCFCLAVSHKNSMIIFRNR